jgi:class 3 adenylate cyclase
MMEKNMPDNIMAEKPIVLVVDDTPDNLTLISGLLRDDYRVKTATNGERAVKVATTGNPPDIILLDIMMPVMDGYEACRQLKAITSTQDIPIIFLTAKAEIEDEMKGFKLGAADYITKPISPPILQTRIKTQLEIKKARDYLSGKNAFLENEVQLRTKELVKLNRLTRYFSPKLAERLLSDDDFDRVRRKNLTIFFTDIRGFTRISDEVEPEDLFNMLNEYFTQMTQVVFRFGGTLGKCFGDTVMGFFGDPEECPSHAEVAVRMALEMQAKAKLINERSHFWKDYPLNIGIGINTGFVTVGNVGMENHKDYTVIGRHVNLAARLTEEAKAGQILITNKTHCLVENLFNTEPVGQIGVKGFDSPIMAYKVLRNKGAD